MEKKEPIEDRFFRVVAGMEKRLETRLKALEDKFLAFQCGAQTQMERNRQAAVWESIAAKRLELRKEEPRRDGEEGSSD